MHQEIERKFLVRKAFLPTELGPGVGMAQGYLSYAPSVRVRHTVAPDGTSRGFLTIKGPGLVSRAEFEYEIPAGDAEALLAMCPARLTKVRYHVPVGQHIFELDRFSGAHTGLWLAEVELEAVDEAFTSPPWLGREVSGDPRFTNGALARAGCVPAEALEEG